jgi:hypothetical protein
VVNHNSIMKARECERTCIKGSLRALYTPPPRPTSMVCVLPVPVCPYANTVDSYPLSTSEITGARVWSNTSFCVENDHA